jgi:hypothetical protein
MPLHKLAQGLRTAYDTFARKLSHLHMDNEQILWSSSEKVKFKVKTKMQLIVSKTKIVAARCRL